MSSYISDTVDELVKKYHTRNPFELIEALGIYLDYPTLNNLKGFFCVINRERHIAINNNLTEYEQTLVAAHELGHDRLHLNIARMSPMKDFQLYDMTSKPEYQANFFAAELLIPDDDVITLASDIDMDYYKMSHVLNVNPNLLTFKLHAMNQKGHNFNLPHNISSRFLGNK